MYIIKLLKSYLFTNKDFLFISCRCVEQLQSSCKKNDNKKFYATIPD